MSTRLRRLADVNLGYTLLVILWGAFVRATGSGAGCGSHWPMCNGEVIPRAPTTATLIELTHRITSGAALLLVVLLVWVARRQLPKGHRVRSLAHVSLFFMCTEALVGAGLVLFEKVADDASAARAMWMSAHLINTLFLLASQGICSWAARNEHRQFIPSSTRARALLLSAAGAFLLVGVTGAIAALGDTLFPAQSLAHGLAQDLDPNAHPFLRLRALHPFIAVATSLHLLIVSATFAKTHEPQTRLFASWVGIGAILQVALGLLNLLLSAPVFMQLVHLLAADLLWLSLVWLTASGLSESRDKSPGVVSHSARLQEFARQ